MIPILPNILQMGGHFTSMICGNLTILELGTGMLIHISSLEVSIWVKSNTGILENAKTSIIPKFPDSAESLFSYVSE